MEEMIDAIRRYDGKPVRIMEVCGTHTMNLGKYGIKQILPPAIELISGPGCPVCVTPSDYLSQVCAYSREHSCILMTFGDLLKVPFQGTSLAKERSCGLEVRIIYSPLECLTIAREEPEKEAVFLGVGFETTAPLTALMLAKAKEQGISNLKCAVAHKSILPAIERLLQEMEEETRLLYPGNVAVILGARPFQDISDQYGVKGSICGFSPEEMIQSIYSLLYGRELFANHYQPVVSESGNLRALARMNEVFRLCDSVWRGMGEIKDSGYALQQEFAEFEIPMEVKETESEHGCLCGEILTGKRRPAECRFFGTRCTPCTPVGPCMVTSEGTCGAAYMTEW